MKIFFLLSKFKNIHSTYSFIVISKISNKFLKSSNIFISYKLIFILFEIIIFFIFDNKKNSTLFYKKRFTKSKFFLKVIISLVARRIGKRKRQTEQRFLFNMRALRGGTNHDSTRGVSKAKQPAGVSSTCRVSYNTTELWIQIRCANSVRVETMQLHTNLPFTVKDLDPCEDFTELLQSRSIPSFLVFCICQKCKTLFEKVVRNSTDNSVIWLSHLFKKLKYFI